MANEAFTKTWAIALASDDTFETITDFYATVSSPRPGIKRSSISIEGMDGDYRFQDVRIIKIKTMVSLLDMLRMESKIYIEKDILLQRFTN